jgi:hypothetical protein
MFSSHRKFHPLRAAASAGLKGALPKVLLGAALLGGGDSVLFAGSASAITLQEWINAGAAGITIGDKNFVYESSVNLPTTTVPAGSPDDVSFTHINNTDYFLLYDFRSPEFDSIEKFSLNYTVNITPAGIAAGNFFSFVDNDSTVSTINSAQENLETTFTGGIAPVIITSINGSPNIAEVLGAPTSLSVRNLYDRNLNDGSISSWQNSFRQSTKVPGPLPLLGAGVAFGFSRKLRSRIKATVQA